MTAVDENKGFAYMTPDRVVLLDENTANRIAAGEVVERPASAVKELVENAIDAGATQILVTLDEAGKRKLAVADNGMGMTRTDAIMALQRHATSKIRSAEDLFAIETLGFRGEALPSIASVSRFTLTTKPEEDESGTRLTVVGGDILSVEEVACRNGTTIEVDELFYNTPARLKFLKSNPAEASRVVEVVGCLGAAYPDIGFRLRNGAAEQLTTPGSGEPLAALAAVWGREIARKLIPISYSAAGLRVSGHIATPEVTRPGRSHELFFVNRRPIKSRLLAHALEDAFRALTPESRYPIAAIFVDIDADMVDVNVHPTKTEVKFTRDGDVHHAVSQAVKSALLAFGIVPTVRVETPSLPALEPTSQFSFQLGRATSPLFQPQPGDAADISGATLSDGSIGGTGGEGSVAVGNGLDRWADMSRSEIQGAHGSDVFGPTDPAEASVDSTEASPLVERQPPRPFAEQLREFRVLGQARNTYIIALTPDGIAVIDQHVAHERVLYERLTVKRFSNGLPVQRLAIPITVSLSRREALLLAEHLPSFAASGWDIAPFGGESFVVRSIPAMLVNKQYERILHDMIDELVNQTVSRRLIVQQEHVTITNACKLAVKAGDPLNIPEMEGLLLQLAETENPYLCPHGRPIVVMIPFGELDRQFKRA